MRRLYAALPVLALLAAFAQPAHAQQTNEDRLRDALKRQMSDLRAAQDSQAALQAQVSDLTKQRDALQQQLDQAKAQLAAKVAPVAKAPPPPDDAELKKLHDDLDAAHKDNADLQAALVKWQSAYKDAAALAQSRDAEAKRLDAAFKDASGKLDTCKAANTKLIATAKDILHLYETEDFRSLLVKSYEPILGLARTRLENTVQDYEDKIYDGKYTGGKTTP